MLIRTQNKEGLVNFDNINDIQIEPYKSDVSVYKGYQEIIGYHADIKISLGYYSSLEKAIKILDKIQRHYRGHVIAMLERDEFVDPVFEMPKDEEVKI